MNKAHLEEAFFKLLMWASALIVGGSLVGLIAKVLVTGIPALNLDMITRLPEGGYYLGKGGGILNAIVGSLLLAFGATASSLVLSLPIAFYLQKEYVGRCKLARIIRIALDVLWGVPSIVYGASGFVLMVYLGIRASLLGGVIVLTFVEFPMMARAMDEVMRTVPQDLKEASYAIGANRLETTFKVATRQVMPALFTAVLIAFGRGIGDAASVLFTAGYSDYLPSSPMEPVASLPLAVFFQLGTPFPEVQQRAYASAAILLILILIVSGVARLFAIRSQRFVIR